MSWIPVTEKVPHNTDEVLLYRVDGVKIGYYQDGKWYLVPRIQLEMPPTHWMEIPELEKEGK